MNMNPPNDSGIPDDESDLPDFGRRNPLEIGVSLRNLVNRADFLTVNHGTGQIVTRLLAVNPGARTFIFDWGGLPEQNRGHAAHGKPDVSRKPRWDPRGIRHRYAA